jgi:hypothetical protein
LEIAIYVSTAWLAYTKRKTAPHVAQNTVSEDNTALAVVVISAHLMTHTEISYHLDRRSVCRQTKAKPISTCYSNMPRVETSIGTLLPLWTEVERFWMGIFGLLTIDINSFFLYNRVFTMETLCLLSKIPCFLMFLSLNWLLYLSRARLTRSL